jgi:hypothetical protein
MKERVYLSTAQAAAELGVSSGAVLNWAKAGRFPGAFRTPGGSKREGDWRIPVAAIELFRAGGSSAESAERGEE